ncbi:NEW3 domain-containing protein [Actinokineospora guangxiensis]|uniref:NEW3 domain-containing protein n=1 Tax=Actinokineospora guangxiensis TaxID=1490288 RepID=A0ABW0EP41_9PSEU
MRARLLLLLAALGIALAVPVPAAAAASGVAVEIGAVDLDGPAVSTVEVTVRNGGTAKLSKLTVTFTAPIGWTTYPASRSVKGSLSPGRTATVEFLVHVPERPAAFTVRQFSATATYTGGDGARIAAGTRLERSGTPLANLPAAFGGVAVSSEADPAKGDFDGSGNSFSAEKLAEAGITPGAAVTALGATLRWPSSPVGTPDNAAGGGKTIEFTGQGGKLVFLGSGSSTSATSTVTVWYTDGTSTTATLGFPNWSFQDAGAHGATLVASSTGRNRPNGYGDAAYQYRVFANSIPLDPAKTVELVTLPNNGAVHVFALATA